MSTGGYDDYDTFSAENAPENGWEYLAEHSLTHDPVRADTLASEHVTPFTVRQELRIDAALKLLFGGFQRKRIGLVHDE